jgi:outer membrane protein TolC
MLAKLVRPPLIAAALAALPACTLSPNGLDAERDAAAKAGAPFEPSPEERRLPELPDHPTWSDVLGRAFLANGELEARYFEWKAALARAPAAGAWPNTDLSAGFSYMFSSQRMKSFDRATFTAAPDSAANLTIPAKARKAAAVALDQAREAGERFRAAKFDLQKQVLFAWADYTERAREISLADQEVALLRVDASAALARQAVAGGRRTSTSTRLAAQQAEIALADLRAQHDAQRAALNSLLSRDPHAPLAAPEGPSEPRRIPADDASLLRASAEMFPEVAAMARELEGRQDALELARLRWVPDINPVLSITGTVSQSIGAVVVLPTTIAQIRGQIEEAQAQVRAADARLRQGRATRIGEYVALIVELRRAEQRASQLRDLVRPGAEAVLDAASREYESGAGSLSSVIEARRAMLQIGLAQARTDADIEHAIVDIECCLGVDIETIGQTGEVTHG